MRDAIGFDDVAGTAQSSGVLRATKLTPDARRHGHLRDMLFSSHGPDGAP